MNSYVCDIYRLKSAPTKAVIMTESLRKKLGCTSGSSIRLRCGNKEVISRIATVRNKPGDALYAPASVCAALALPSSSRVRLSYHNKTLRLGPVIGILTTGFTGTSTQPFGSRTSLFQQFLTASKGEGPYFFVFTPGMVDWHREIVNGWFLHYHPTLKKFIWRSDRAPLPDVVYDRVPNRKVELAPSVMHCKERLLNHRHPVHWFNQGFFNKWQIHEQLYTHPMASEYMPETVLSPEIQSLESMLNRHRMIYLKPSGGSLGMGIIRVTYHPKNGYYCRYYAQNRNVLKRFSSLPKLTTFIFSRQAGRIRQYIAQQGIRLIRFENRPVDFRVHVHKDRHNEWKVAGLAAKVAGTGSVTTHVRTGGSVIPADTLFKHLYGSRASERRQTLERAAIRVAMAVEETTPGQLGELGLDMGLDIRNHVWLFEVNAKPGRHIFYHPQLRAAGQDSARYITEYSLKLADFI